MISAQNRLWQIFCLRTESATNEGRLTEVLKIENGNSDMAKKKVAEEARNMRMATQQPPKQSRSPDVRDGKGTAFPEEERSKLGLNELVPPHVESLEEQVVRAYEAYKRRDEDLERHIYLRAVQDNDEVLFYMLLLDHIEETRLGGHPSDVHRPIPESPRGVHPMGHRESDDQSRGATDHRPRGDGFRFQSDGFSREPTCSLDREEIKDASPSETSTVGPRNGGAKKALLQRKRPSQGRRSRDAVAAISSISSSRTIRPWSNSTRALPPRTACGSTTVIAPISTAQWSPGCSRRIRCSDARVAAHRSHNLTDVIESLPSGRYRPKHKEHHDIL